MNLRHLLPIVGLLVASPTGFAGNNCDAIRARIEAKIRASGVSTFDLQIVAAEAKVPGKVIGTCDLGTKKIVYTQGPAAPAGQILTECKDGSVTYGDCRKP